MSALSILLGSFATSCLVNSVEQNKLGVALNETLIQALVKIDKGCCPFFESLLREKHFKQHIAPPHLSFLELFRKVWAL